MHTWRSNNVCDVQPCEVCLSTLHLYYQANVWKNDNDNNLIPKHFSRTLRYRCLNIHNKKGTLRPGADADLVVLDREGNVLSTWVAGKEVWKKATTIA